MKPICWDASTSRLIAELSTVAMTLNQLQLPWINISIKCANAHNEIVSLPDKETFHFEKHEWASVTLPFVK